MPRLPAELEEVERELDQAFPPVHCQGMETRGKVYLVGADP